MREKRQVWLFTWDGDECRSSFGFTHSDNFGSKGVGGAALLFRDDAGKWSRCVRLEAACEEFVKEINLAAPVTLDVWGSVQGYGRELLWVCPECRCPLACNWFPHGLMVDELEEDEDSEFIWSAVQLAGEHVSHIDGTTVGDERAQMWGDLIDRDFRESRGPQ